jgi:FixJ family two-component response regulator
MHVKRAPKKPVVRIIDDDASVRASLVDLLTSADIEAVAYESPAALAGCDDLLSAGCLVLDVRFSGTNGLDFQAELQSSGNDIPVIVMTGYADVPMTVKAMKAGALDFLTKPFRDQDLIDAVTKAIEKDQLSRVSSASKSALETLSRSLSNREREIMGAVVSGLMNKQIAAKFGISEATVKLHRSNVMRKMQARSLADLVKKAAALNLG